MGGLTMREILFRGKRTDNGEWIYGDLIQNVDCLKIREQEKSIKKITKSYEVDLETVGQFTGLLDKNGKKIFEGDIVLGLFLFDMSINAVVKFRDGAFGLEWRRGEIIEFNAFTSLCNITYEIIGNIYDNPELLEG